MTLGGFAGGYDYGLIGMLSWSLIPGTIVDLSTRVAQDETVVVVKVGSVIFCSFSLHVRYLWCEYLSTYITIV